MTAGKISAPNLRAPQPVYIAAAIAIVQSLVVIVFGLFLAYRTVSGADNSSMVFDAATPGWVGVGTAIFLLISFGFVIAGSVAMLHGRRWGRGAVVLLELILAASSFQMMSGGALLLGLVVLFSALAALVLVLFVPSSVNWAAAQFS